MTLTKPMLVTLGLLGLYAVLAWTAGSSKSAIYDESLHVTSSLAIKQLGDFRVDSEDPALFKQWLAITQPERTLPTESSFWKESGKDAPAQWAWGVQAVFARPQDETMSMIDHARLPMLAVAVGLGALLAAWAWQVGGPVAGVIAVALFALDPNFLGHGPIAKNDVMAAAGYAATAWSLWCVGRRVTIGGVVALALAVAATMTVKFSGVLLAAIVPLTLIARALMNVPWPMQWLPLPGGERAGVRGETSRDEKGGSGGDHPKPAKSSGDRGHSQTASASDELIRDSAAQGDAAQSPPSVSPLTPALSPPGRGSKFLTAIVISVFVAGVVYLGIWFSYGFRYAVSPDPAYALSVADQAGPASILAKIDSLHLLPQSYTFGLAYTLKSAQHRSGFLLGQTSETGWWYYFPVAMAVKTPLATIAMLLTALGMIMTRAGRLRLRGHAWLAICLLIPAAVYTFMAMRSSLNLGIRHMLPVYPLAYITIAVALARYRKGATVLLLLLAIESFIAFPDYIAYFNLAAGGSRGGIRILSDSNLDWGQDLKSLAKWQEAHPTTRLYLSYFGTAAPASYNVDAINAVAGYAYDPQTFTPDQPGVLAVSATQLQGMYVSNELKPFFEVLRQKTPREVLGGTIYLYDVPGMTADAVTAIISPSTTRPQR